MFRFVFFLFFFFNDTATTEIYTLSLHDALPISEIVKKYRRRSRHWRWCYRLGATGLRCVRFILTGVTASQPHSRSEEHTAELQSQAKLVCPLLLGKKKE